MVTYKSTGKIGVYRAYFLFGLFFIILLSTSCSLPKKEQIFRRDELMMDTIVSIQIVHTDSHKAQELLNKSFDIMKTLAVMLDSHNPKSEVFLINRKAFQKPIKISRDLEEVIQKSFEISRISGGAFDITVVPLLKLWPIYGANKFTIPDKKAIADALKLVGWQNIKLDTKNHTVRFEKKGLSIDLGGIAKGYIVDRVANFLRKAGVKGALINAGGDIYALGGALNGGSWRIGIQHPRKHNKLVAILKIKDKAVVTSGDYERFVIKNGTRYTHIVDPRTGFTIRKTASVTLIGNSTAFIDGLATAIMVVGPVEGRKIVDGLPGIDGLFITEKKLNKLHFQWTPGFVPYVSWATFIKKASETRPEKPHSSIH